MVAACHTGTFRINLTAKIASGERTYVLETSTADDFKMWLAALQDGAATSMVAPSSCPRCPTTRA